MFCFLQVSNQFMADSCYESSWKVRHEYEVVGVVSHGLKNRSLFDQEDSHC
jgi:hypothetical protein